MNRVYRVAGLNFSSPIPLSVPACEDGSEPDVRVQLAPPADVPDAVPAGTVLQDISYGRWRAVLVDEGDRLRMRYLGFLEALYAPDGSCITVIPGRDFPLGMLPVMLAASLLGPVLNLRGYTCLHASGVVLDEQLIAVAAPSGGGKTTIATALVAAGGGLLTDDLMPLTDRGGAVITDRCSTSLRLREGSVALGSVPAGADVAVSADHRQVWTPPNPAADGARAPAVILFPMTRADIGTASLEPMDPQQALIALLQYGKRSLGVQHRQWRERDLQRLSRLVQATPVCRLVLRRGEVVPAELVHLLRGWLEENRTA